MDHRDIEDVEKQAGWSKLFSGRNLAYSLVIFGGTIIHAVSVYITITILPSVVRDIGGLDYYAWSTTLFVVASIIGAAIAPRLLASWGPRGAYLVAAGTFALSTLVCAFAPSMPVLLAGRAIEGLGGGALYALSYSLIRIVFHERLWSRAIGAESAMWGVATLIGPTIGGVFAEFDIWRGAFWLLLTLITVFIVLAATVLPRGREAEAKAGGLPVAQLLVLTAATLTLSLSGVAQDVRWMAFGIMLAIGLLALLLFAENSAKNRILPRETLRRSSAIGVFYALFALLTIGTQPEIFAPFFLQNLHGQSPLVAGYMTALMAASWALSSMFSSGWTGAASRRAVVASPILMLVGLVMGAIFVPLHSSGDWTMLLPVCLSLVVLGAGIGAGWPHLYTLLAKAAPTGEQDLAVSAIVTVQLFAVSLGAASAGLVANLAGLTNPGGIEGISNAALWLFAVFALAPMIAIVLARRTIER